MNYLSKILAIPSIKVAKSVTKAASERIVRKKTKENKIIVQELLDSCVEEQKAASVLLEVKELQEKTQLHEQLKQQQDTIQNLEEKVKQMEESTTKSESVIVQLKNEVENSKKLHVELQETSEEQFVTKCKARFQPVLTPKQIQVILRKSTRTVWDMEDLSRAFTLRYHSFKGYVYMRNTLHLPLPSISTLQKWAAKFEMKPGILTDILRLMKAAGTKMTKFERTAVLSFDEVKVQEIYEYFKKYDQILGPHKNMQVYRMFFICSYKHFFNTQ